MTVTEHTATSGRHTTFYLAAGPEDGPLLIFVHGWPELSISWRPRCRVTGHSPNDYPALRIGQKSSVSGYPAE
jgi:pimeloyl-ACP methyl ester carboxylesterase